MTGVWHLVEIDRVVKELGTWKLEEYGFANIHYPGKHYAEHPATPIRDDVKGGTLCLLTGHFIYSKLIF